MREDNYEAGLHELQLAKDEAEATAEDFYEKYWPFQTDEIAAQHGELQFTAVIMLAEFEQFAQQGSIKSARERSLRCDACSAVPLGLGIDVGLWPRNVGVAVITSTVLGEHLGLGQISDISRTTEAPERQTYETVAHSDDQLTPKRPGFAGAFVCVAYTKG